MDIGAPELLLILLLVVLLFGVGRLVKLGGELGQGIREFRRGLKGENSSESGTEFESIGDTIDNNIQEPDQASDSPFEP